MVPTKHMQMLEIFSYQSICAYILREASQQSREVKVTHFEDPIEVTSGNLRNQDTVQFLIILVDNSITETVRGGVRALPHV